MSYEFTNEGSRNFVPEVLHNYSRVVFEEYDSQANFKYWNATPGKRELSLSPNHLEDETWILVREPERGNLDSGDTFFIQTNNQNPRRFLSSPIGLHIIDSSVANGTISGGVSGLRLAG